MIVWRIRGERVGPNGTDVAYFGKRSEAFDAWCCYVERYRREHGVTVHTTYGRYIPVGDTPIAPGSPPEKITLCSKQRIIDLLNNAVGWRHDNG